MFTLNYKIKDEIIINGARYIINMAFDNVLRLYDLWDDQDTSEVNKVFIALVMLFNLNEIEELEELFGMAIEFEVAYDILTHILETFVEDGKQEVKVDRLGNPLPIKKTKPVFSFKYDAAYIYSSFVQAYRIDLLEEQGKLHWVKFKALLDGLPQDSKFAHVIDIRTRELPSGKHSKDERKALIELKNIYALPGDEPEGEDDE